MSGTTRALVEPEGWRLSNLTMFFHRSHENRKATFVHFPDYARELSELDVSLKEFWAAPIKSPHRIVSDLLSRSHILLLNTCEMSFSSQFYPTMVLGRAAIEAYGYAALIHHDISLSDIWLRRTDSRNARNRAREVFAFSKWKSALKTLSVDLAEKTESMYNRCLDFGAHPNSSALIAMSEEQEHDDGLSIRQVALTGDEDIIESALKTSFEIGLCLGGTISHVFSNQSPTANLSKRLFKLMEQHNHRMVIEAHRQHSA